MRQEEYEHGWEFFSSDKRFPVKDQLPFLNDDGVSYGYDSHYVLHTAWAARVLAEIKPVKHVDISSYIYFSSLVSAFVPIEFYDYRKVSLPLSGVVTGSADLTKLAFASDSVRSLSCMHVMEHIGLGRYGDPLDTEGDIKSAHELQRVLAPGGDLLVVVPVGRPRVMFNAHRIYSYEQVMEMFDGLILHEFSLIPDSGGLIRGAEPLEVGRQTYGCGCFWFKKTGIVA